MFGGLKKKLKGALGLFSKKVDEEAAEEEIIEEVLEEVKPVPVKEPVVKKESKSKPVVAKAKVEKKVETVPVVEVPVVEVPVVEEPVVEEPVVEEPVVEEPVVDVPVVDVPVVEEPVVDVPVVDEPVVEEPVVEGPVVEEPVVEEPVVEGPVVEEPVVEEPVVEEAVKKKPKIEKVAELEPVEANESEAFDARETDVSSEPVDEPKAEKKGFFSKLKSAFTSDETETDEPVEEESEKEVEVVEEVSEPEVIKSEPVVEEIPEPEVEEPTPVPVAEPKEEKKGFFAKVTKAITTKKLSESQFDDLFFELEIVLLENNVAIEVIERIKDDLKTALVDKAIKRSEIESTIFATLKETVEDILTVEPVDLLKNIKAKNDAGEPYIISVIGVNGSGKTTTLAKLVHYFKKHNLVSVIAACDTFRAAAIQQLEEHANKLETKIIKHDYGADAAAVAFDAVAHARAKGLNVVLVDTAGRLHSNTDLMAELEKVNRVTNPDFTLFLGESITGNDCVEQASQFNEAVGIDGIVLSKADIDDKGGAALSVSYVTQKPILFFGTGQTYDDLIPFDRQKVIDSLGL